MITQKEKRNIYDWRLRRKLQGWKYLTILLPADIKKKIVGYEDILMAERDNTKP
jgi:hypothetical protein